MLQFEENVDSCGYFSTKMTSVFMRLVIYYLLCGKVVLVLHRGLLVREQLDNFVGFDDWQVGWKT